MNIKNQNRSGYHAGPLLTLAGLVFVVACGAATDCVWGQSETAQQTAQPATPDREKDPLGLQLVPDQAEGIGVDSNEGTFIDGDVTFYDSENRLVRFGDFFGEGKKPMMLSFNYSNCPKLCSVQLENITLALREVDLQIGKDFNYVSVSMDPKESTETAKKTKELYAGMYNRSGSESGWHFLVGKKANIDKLADQCGYKFKYIPAQNDYSHLPAIILISPEGEIVRYIPGLNYEPDTIRLALIETAAGKIGSPVDWAAYSLGCFSYNATMGKYTFQAMALMRIGGLITIAAILIGLVPYWFFRRHNSDVDPGKKMSAAT